MASHRDFVSVRAATGGRDGNLKGGLWRRRTTQGGTLCQGGSYQQFAGEQIKIKWVIVARTACLLYGSSSPVKVVRGRDGRCAPAFFVGGSTVDSARRAGSFAG